MIKFNIKNLFYFTLVIFLLFESWYFFSRNKSSSIQVKTRSNVFEPRTKKFDELVLQNKKDKLPLLISNGRWSFIFIGYTRCPDVCPTTMLLLSDVFKKLQKIDTLQDQYQGVFAAIDFKNEKIQDVQKYAAEFHHNILGALADKDETDRFVNWIGAGYTLENDLISHSTSIYLTNPKGELLGEFVNPNNSDEIVKEFIRLYKKNSEPIVIKNFRIQIGQTESKVMVGHFDLYNNSNNDIELQQVSCDGFIRTEMHDMRVDEKLRMMTMEKLSTIKVLKNSKLEFKPKNKHLMIFLEKKPNFDEHVRCEFKFDNNQRYYVFGKIEKGTN